MVTSSKRNWALLLAGIAVIAMIILSAGLSELDFSFGEPFSPRRQPQSETTGVGLPSGEGEFNNIILGLLALFQLLLPIAFIYFIFSRDARKRVLRTLFSLLWIIALYVLLRSGKIPLNLLETEYPEALSFSEALSSDVEFVYAPPPWLVTFMTISLALLIAALIIGSIYYLWRRMRHTSGPLEYLTQEAQDALDALHAGADLKDTIMRCYFEMSQVLIKGRGIRRDMAMTPREFERNIKEAGIPGEHVQQLTRLFEAVRYGAKVLGAEEERLAIESLTKIAETVKNTP